MNISNLIDYRKPQLILLGSRPEVNRTGFILESLKELKKEKRISVLYYTFGFMGPDFEKSIHQMPVSDECSFSVVSCGFVTIEQLCDYCRDKNNSRMIVLDWLNLSGLDMEKAVKRLRRVANESNRVIIAAFNTPRHKDPQKRLFEDMAAVTDMGKVYDLADDIWFLYPDDDKVMWNEQNAEMVVAKGKMVSPQKLVCFLPPTVLR